MISSARTFWSLPGTGFTLLILRPSNLPTFLMMILLTFPSFMTQGDRDFVIWLQRYYTTIIKVYYIDLIDVHLSYCSVPPLLRKLLFCTYFSSVSSTFSMLTTVDFFSIQVLISGGRAITTKPPFIVGQVSMFFSHF